MVPRALLLVLSLVLAAPLVSEAQQPGKVPRVAVIRPGPAPDAAVVEIFKEALRDLGYAEDRNVIMDWRFAEGKPERVTGIASELIQLNTNVIVTFGNAMTWAVQQATKAAIPIVAMSDDFLATGLVVSLARPGGNVTGVSIFSPELNVKRLELLKEVVPKLASVVALWDPSIGASQLHGTETAAKSLGLQLRALAIRAVSDLPATFEVAKPGQTEALNVLGSPFLFAQRLAIINFAARNRLPSIYEFKEAVEDGGLLSYGSSRPSAYRAIVGLIDKILKGAKPGDLPIQQPSKFELVINLKTAKALGVTIPPSLLLRADQVIE